MKIGHYRRLLAYAHRCTLRADEAEDLVHDAVIAALAAGRAETDADMAFVCGIIRNQARQRARSAVRRRRREGLWLIGQGAEARGDGADPADVLAGLSPALKPVAALVLSGHNRREIAYLLSLSDVALRQRLAALKSVPMQRGLVRPEDMAGLSLDLAYGRIRDALLSALLRHGGTFACHDPDGHIFLIRTSRT